MSASDDGHLAMESRPGKPGDRDSGTGPPSPDASTTVDDSAGVPMHAPTLIVPRVFDFPLCEFLVQFYDQNGGEVCPDSGLFCAAASGLFDNKSQPPFCDRDDRPLRSHTARSCDNSS